MADKMTAPVFPAIPVPGTDGDSLRTAVLALKQSVDMLTGGDGQSKDGSTANRFAPHVFLQGATPTAFHPGDLWLCTGTNYTLNIWDGSHWLLIATLPAPPATTAAEAYGGYADGFSRRGP